MALRLAGEEAGLQERIDFIDYQPLLQNSGDLEAGTKTVTATAKPGTADYTTTLTLPMPTDSRMQVKNVGGRLQITIDSINAPATLLNYDVEINGVSKISGSFNSTGAKYDGVNLSGVDIAAGGQYDVQIYLWVDADSGGGVVVSVAQVWLAVGVYGSDVKGILSLNHRGLAQFPKLSLLKVGTGSPSGFVFLKPQETAGLGEYQIDWNMRLMLLGGEHYLSLYGTVDTDLLYIRALPVLLRRLE